jgi:hypothetical protein
MTKPDDDEEGPLTAAQVRQIRKRVPQGKKRSVRTSLSQHRVRSDAAWRELVELERPAAYDPETGRLLAPIGPGWWHIVNDQEDRLYDEDAARMLLAPGGWTLTGSLTVLLYSRDEDDDRVV